MIWYTYRMETLFTDIIGRNVAAFEAAEALETALVNQKGFVSYYFLDGNPDWLKQLGTYRQVFRQRLGEVRAVIEKKEEEAAVDLIESEYGRYIELKDQVIDHYRLNERDKGSKIHVEVRHHFFRILDLCEQFKILLKNSLAGAWEEAVAGRSSTLANHSRLRHCYRYHISRSPGISAGQPYPGAYTATDHEADREGAAYRSDNEVKALRHSVKGLIEDVDRTHIQLERSSESLLQAEKMALVGKLAAGTAAHSIRNPLTSLKMRLFSLSRSLELSPVQKEDFDVISEEIQHIDTIVQNFLEFSRPPKLKNAGRESFGCRGYGHPIVETPPSIL